MASMTLTVADTTELAPMCAGFVAKANELMAIEDTEGLVALRNNNVNAMLDLREVQKKMEAGAKMIKEFLESVCAPDEDSLPKNIKWNKQSFTTTFENPMAAVFRLIELENTPMENFLKWVTPKQAAEAAGITEDRLRASIGEMIVDKPKARTLNIK